MNTQARARDGGEQVRGMSSDKHGFHYADMEMDGSDDQGMVIPPRPAATADGQLTPNEKVRRFIESFHIATGEKAFVQQAQQLAEYVEREADYAPFKRYYPQYDSMTESQRKWYFYWRNEVRYERYLRSDLSYIFLYVYELINGIGWQDPQDGYYMLMEIWTAYRSDFPKLDDYMGDWIADFVLVHQLDIPFAELAERVPHGIFGSKDLYELELLHRFQQETIDFTLEMLAALSDYNVMRSKFYLGGGRKDLETYVPKVLAVVDRYLLAKHGQRLIDYLHPGEVEKRERVLFRGALYDSSLHGKRVKIGVVPLSTHPPLRAMVTQLIRLTENTLRKLHGFKGKLRVEAVDEEIRLLVERYLEREYDAAQAAKRPRPSVSIDTEKLAQLQVDSDQVRDWLTIEEEESLLTAAEVKADTRAMDEAADMELIQEPEQVEKAADPADQVECSTANDASEQRSESITDVSVQAASAAGLDEDWTALAESLQPVHLQVLQVLLRDSGAEALFQLAGEHGSMPELLIEEINTAAMETIGDLVIDEEAIVEEYMNIVEQWLGDER